MKTINDYIEVIHENGIILIKLLQYERWDMAVDVKGPCIQGCVLKNYVVEVDEVILNLRVRRPYTGVWTPECYVYPLLSPVRGVLYRLWENDSDIHAGMTMFRIDTAQEVIDALPPIIDAQVAEHVAAVKRYREQEEMNAIREQLIKKEHRRQLRDQVRQTLQKEGLISSRAEGAREPVPRELVGRIYIRDGGRCVYCGSSENIHIDHIIPVARGGATVFENLQILCQRCNLEKSDNIG